MGKFCNKNINKGISLEYFTIYDKVSFRDFKSATQGILDSIPNSATISQAISLFIEKYKEEQARYDDVLASAIERNFKKLSIPKEIRLFYILMVLRSRYPQFFPAPSLCVLISHALRGQLKKQQEQKQEPKISIKNIELLPIALLICHEAEEVIVEDMGDLASVSIKKYLLSEESEPIGNWNFNAKKIKKDKYIALSQFPLPHTTLDANIFGQLEKYKASIVFTTWNFLASEEFSSLRSDLLSRNILDTVIQLPLPKREGNKTYPAILVLDHDHPELVSMIDLHTFNQECVSQVYLDLDCEGIVNDSEMYRFNDGYLQEIFANIMNRETFPWAPTGRLYNSYKNIYSKLTSVDIHIDEIHKERAYKLSPLMYITKHRNPLQNSIPLSAIAEVIRCQEPRINIKDQNLSEKDIDQTIFRDITLKDIDSLTGFLILDDADYTKMDLYGAKLEKFTLKENDILLAHKGSKATIGRAGFVDMSFNEDVIADDNFHSMPAVAGTSLLIVRVTSDKIDPIWLFHYLQAKHIQEIISSKATGSSLLSVNLKAIRELPIAIPSRDDIEKKAEYHKKISAHLKEIIHNKRRIEALKNTYENLN